MYDVMSEITASQARQVAEVLDCAADRLDRIGWFGGGGNPFNPDAECALIAIDYCADDAPVSGNLACLALGEEVSAPISPIGRPLITTWNDRQRDKRVVTRALRRTARKLRGVKR